MRRPIGTHPIYWSTFNNLPPDEWSKMTIAQMADVEKGKLPKTLLAKPTDKSVPYLLIDGLNDGVSLHTEDTDLPMIAPGDTIVVADGSRSGLPIHGAAGALGSTLLRYRVKNDFDGDYLYYLFESLYPFTNTATIGGAIPHLDKRLLSQLILAIPEKPEMTVISKILCAVDKMISRTHNEISAAQRLKIAIMQQLFTKGIPGRHSRFKAIRIARTQISIPDEWEIGALSAHCSGPDCVKTGPFGAQLPPDVFRPTGIRMINITDIGEGAITFATEAYVAEEVAEHLRDYLLKKGDLIFSRVASVGRLALITEECDGFLMSSNCIRLRPNSSFNSRFLMHTFLDSLAVSRQVIAASTGGARPIVTPRFLRRMTIPKPPRDEQDEIAGIIEANSRFLSSLAFRAKALEILKKSLLQNLLTGKVRVNTEVKT